MQKDIRHNFGQTLKRYATQLYDKKLGEIQANKLRVDDDLTDLTSLKALIDLAENPEIDLVSLTSPELLMNDTIGFLGDDTLAGVAKNAWEDTQKKLGTIPSQIQSALAGLEEADIQKFTLPLVARLQAHLHAFEYDCRTYLHEFRLECEDLTTHFKQKSNEKEGLSQEERQQYLGLYVLREIDADCTPKNLINTLAFVTYPVGDKPHEDLRHVYNCALTACDKFHRDVDGLDGIGEFIQTQKRMGRREMLKGSASIIAGGAAFSYAGGKINADKKDTPATADIRKTGNTILQYMLAAGGIAELIFGALDFRFGYGEYKDGKRNEKNHQLNALMALGALASEIESKREEKGRSI